MTITLNAPRFRGLFPQSLSGLFLLSLLERLCSDPEEHTMADGGKAREVKVVLLGDTGVGKSSLVLRFVTNNFRPYSESTIGASFMSKMIVVKDTPIKYQIWDTAGQEKVRSETPLRPSGD
jgi:GTPase SAR1 family protein